MDLLDEAGVGKRMHRDGLVHDGVQVCVNGERHHLSFKAPTGKSVVIYGQTEITKDLMDGRAAVGAPTVYSAHDVALHDVDGDRPRVTYMSGGKSHEITCDYIAGCDGSHGVSRQSVPASAVTAFERIYPLGWLGILSETPPVSDELIYVVHPARLCAVLDALADTEPLLHPMPARRRHRGMAGPATLLGRALPRLDKKGPGRPRDRTVDRKKHSRRCAALSPSRCGSAGCSSPAMPRISCRRREPKASIPAASLPQYLARALVEFYQEKPDAGPRTSGLQRALARVWKAERFSWWMTMTLHNISDKPNRAEAAACRSSDYLLRSKAAATAFARELCRTPH